MPPSWRRRSIRRSRWQTPGERATEERWGANCRQPGRRLGLGASAVSGSGNAETGTPITERRSKPVSIRVSTLISFLAVAAAIAVGVVIWSFLNQPPGVVHIERDALSLVNWDELDAPVASFIRQAQAGNVVGASATEYQDALDMALKVDVREHDTIYEFPPLATPAQSGELTCWPHLSVTVRNDTGVLRRVWLGEFCF